jgi:hypothetical protein
MGRVSGFILAGDTCPTSARQRSRPACHVEKGSVKHMTRFLATLSLGLLAIWNVWDLPGFAPSKSMHSLGNPSS